MAIIAIDAMGGDNAPQVVIEAIKLVIKEGMQATFLLYGDEAQISPLIEGYKEQIKLFPTNDEVTANDAPSTALRKKRNSAMYKAIESLKSEANAVISGGNTGALMAIGRYQLGTLPGISRPAITTLIPAKNNQSIVFLDLGANVEVDPKTLQQFAIMGKAFAKSLLNLSNPRIGLLNIGVEENKGTEVIKEANKLLQSDHRLNFCGYIEPDKIFDNIVDVVVADGFTGNIALKAIEGTANLIYSSIKLGVSSSWLARIGAVFLLPTFKKIKNQLDPRLKNGAMLVGLNGIVIKSHGGASTAAYANAIKIAYNLIKQCVNEKIMPEVAEIA